CEKLIRGQSESHQKYFGNFLFIFVYLTYICKIKRLPMRSILSEQETDGILSQVYPELNKIFRSALEEYTEFRRYETSRGIRPPKPRTNSEMMNRYIENYAYKYLGDNSLVTPTEKGGRFWLTINGDLVISLKKLKNNLQP